MRTMNEVRYEYIDTLELEESHTSSAFSLSFLSVAAVASIGLEALFLMPFLLLLFLLVLFLFLFLLDLEPDAGFVNFTVTGS